MVGKEAHFGEAHRSPQSLSRFNTSFWLVPFCTSFACIHIQSIRTHFALYKRVCRLQTDWLEGSLLQGGKEGRRLLRLTGDRPIGAHFVIDFCVGQVTCLGSHYSNNQDFFWAYSRGIISASAFKIPYSGCRQKFTRTVFAPFQRPTTSETCGSSLWPAAPKIHRSWNNSQNCNTSNLLAGSQLASCCYQEFKFLTFHSRCHFPTLTCFLF